MKREISAALRLTIFSKTRTRQIPERSGIEKRVYNPAAENKQRYPLNARYIVIGEIENSFHKNLVDNLRIMFADPTINTAKASLIYSTHYYQLLDFGDRTDKIDVLKRDGADKDAKLNRAE